MDRVGGCFAQLPARRVVAAAAESKGAAVALDGRMVDRPVILKAEQIVGEATLRASKIAE